MYPASFEYSSPATVDEALALLARHGNGAKVLAGGHSLLPLMKLRFAQPAHLVDLRRVGALRGIRRAPDALAVGAMTTHADVAASAEVRDAVPALADAAGHIGDPQVRNRGTIGGSIAHADPGADLPAVLLATDALIVTIGAGGTRTIDADDFFVDIFTTALSPGELLSEVRFPIPAARSGSAYVKQAHPASRYAIAGVAAAIVLERRGERVAQARVALTGVGTKATRAPEAEAVLVGRSADGAAIAAAAARATEGIEMRADAQGDAAYKLQLVRLCAERALKRAAERAR
jgi:carbon-monoxide dehydrogenase medium subunit